jgi:hypothetical protein
MKQTQSFNHPQNQLFSSLFLCLICLLFSETTRAQGPVTFGINAGPNYSYVYNDPSVSASKGKPGASIDFIARIGNRVFFEPDLCFNLLRSKYNFNAETHNLNFITLQLPLMIGYQFIKKDDFNLHAAAGPEGEVNFKKPNDIPGKEYKCFTSGGRVTAGADVGRLMFDLSLSAVFDGLEKNSKQKMNSFSLGVGVKL